MMENTLLEFHDIPPSHPKEAEMVASQVLWAFLEGITQALLEGKRVELRGFGSFTPRTRKAKKGFDIRRKKTVMIEEKRYVSFKPGKRLRELP